MDVKSVFLHGYINEEVSLSNLSVEDEKKPNHVYKLKKGTVLFETST